MNPKLLLTLTCVAVVWGSSMPLSAQTNGAPSQRVYEMFACSETDSAALHARNEALVRSGADKRGLLAGLGVAIASSYTDLLIQETVSATSNLIEFAVSAIRTWINKARNERKTWMTFAESHCHFQQQLHSERYIDDFYYAPSTSGALDPLNMKFKGFGCMCYLKPTDAIGRGQLPKAPYKEVQDTTREDDAALWEFYLTCKLREDSLGRAHIINHSKFYMDIDHFVFDTRHASLPNDSIYGKPQKPFDFEKRCDLSFHVNVKVFSSWINEAIMLTEDKQIGEFNIFASIDPDDLTKDGVFVYNPEKHKGAVQISGESFLVPRSYTGTVDAPSWGTGQYRLEIRVSEDCCINRSYYMTEAKNGKGMVWDKNKWKPEWEEMKENCRGESVLSSAWQSVSTAYVGRDWVQELISPLVSTVSTEEQVALSGLLDVETLLQDK